MELRLSTTDLQKGLILSHQHVHKITNSNSKQIIKLKKLGKKGRQVAMSSLTTRQFFHITHNSQVQICPSRSIPLSTAFITNKNRFFNLSEFSSYQNFTVVVKAGGGDGSISSKDQDYEDGVSLGTMKLPSDIDLARFETLLFQVLLLIVNLFSR